MTAGFTAQAYWRIEGWVHSFENVSWTLLALDCVNTDYAVANMLIDCGATLGAVMLTHAAHISIFQVESLYDLTTTNRPVSMLGHRGDIGLV